MDWPPSPADRESLILAHYPVVRMIAARLVRRLPSHVDADELINIGTVGLIEAIDRFDPARAVPFKSFAELRIKGSMVDALRQGDWVPRSVRRKFRRIEEARVKLKAALARDPTRDEMAGELELSAEEYDDLVGDSLIRQLGSLDMPIDEDGTTTVADQVRADGEGADETWIREETTLAVKEAVGHLPDKERTVLTLFYLKGMKLREIGDILGVTESRACQLRNQGVQRLKVRLGSVLG
jgi:RNA polymerase sigma factor for flagellar operon FliA